MYTTCLFCHAGLGTNEAIEHFPVGRRLAFDAGRGRLWVVCRKCERWNLSPIEERWEAVEECERLFTATRIRVSSDNIGLARIAEGLELVRIGKPLRPEMAAWRYGDQFGRRRRRYMLATGAATAVGAGIVLAGPLMGAAFASGWGMLNIGNTIHTIIREQRVRARIAVPGQPAPFALRGKDLKQVVMRADRAGLSIRLPPVTSSDTWRRLRREEVTLHGDDALRAAATLLPVVNSRGASKEKVNVAVRLLDEAPDAGQLFFKAAVEGPYAGMKRPSFARPIAVGGGEIFLDRIPDPMLLALEMASHEDIERRAMEGELALLERAWQQAEEVAAIADSLLMPDEVSAKVAALTKPGAAEKG